MQTHRVFGLTLASDFPFAHRLDAGRGAPDLIFSLGTAPVLEGDGSRIYSSPWRDETGESISHLDRFPDMEVLRFPATADFYLEPGRITAHLLDPARRDLMELRLLGPVLSYWLERLGILALHASAVRIGAGAAGFVAHSGGGKSSLTATLVRAGASLLTDDILPVEEAGGTFLARPGYPQMRMEPDSALHFLGKVDGLAAVCPDDSKLHVPVGSFGAFCDAAVPLVALYVVERRPGPLEILPLSRSQAVIELVRHSFSPYLVEAAGLQSRRLDLFSRLVRQVPVRRLSCPVGLEHLPQVAEILLSSAM
ncbi:MAG TPA: hypothetical protein VN493_21660 [Thermoanaerobaculia bacterium]|nr:hypothetical protein [Thermoanaerobaculia bacterium]